jgi:hypothetical protein
MACLTLVACKSGTNEPGAGNPRTGPGLGADFSQVGHGSEVNQIFELNPVRDLDLLFVVQNTAGMAAKQKALADALPGLFEEMSRIRGGLPNLHVGVTTTDLGAGIGFPNQLDACARPGGDRGIFRGNGCPPRNPTTAFFTSFQNGTQNNFEGKLADLVGCQVQAAGERGCAFSHALQATRIALYESITPENMGFLRRDAFLHIVLLADRDDCSAETNAHLFAENLPGQDRLLRCSREGHECNGVPPPLSEDFTAPLAACGEARTRALIKTSEMMDSLRALKARPDHQIALTVIGGWTSGPADVYRYTRGPAGITEVPICQSALGSAWVGLRLRNATAAFGMNGRMHDICQPDLAETAREIGRSIATSLGAMCLTEVPVDADPATPGDQPFCQFTLRERTPEGGERDLAVPPCRDGGERPCFQFKVTPSCPRSELAVELQTADGTAAVGSSGWLRCATRIEGSPPAPKPCSGPSCNSGRLGQTCSAGTEMPGWSQGLFRGAASECASGLCLRPARDFNVASNVDTGPTCTAVCASDADCGFAELRDRKDSGDRRCQSGYTCAVPFEVGPLCCRKLCVCKDFLPRTGAQLPASCDLTVPAGDAACPNRP